MFPRVSSSCLWLVVVASLAPGVLHAQLASKSPFMPPQAAGGNVPTAGAPLEYRGYMQTSNGVQYRLYDPGRKIAAWVKLNEKNGDLDVLAKQHDNEMLTIEHQGRTLTLELKKPKIVSAGSAAQAMPPPPAPTPVAPANVPPAVTQAVVLNPTPADEQRRLEAVAAEVARRRALREQATQQIGQGQPPQVNVPQPPQPQAQPSASRAGANFQPAAPQNARQR